MRKQTKLVAVLSAAALLAIGASMTSIAATGWQEENGTWVYYDKNGETVTEQWAKSGNNWFWLNEDGEMATDFLVDDDSNYYYVDANGAMVTNQWVSIENEDYDGDSDDDPLNYWYYFGANGKAYKSSSNSNSASFKTINGKKYIFNDEAQMLYGWIDTDGQRVTGDDDWREGVYYCGDENDGAQKVGEWAYLDIIDNNWDEIDTGLSSNNLFDDEDQTRYFYFKTNGKKMTDEKGKTINGRKYSFDEYGRMNAEWVNWDATPSTASAGSATYTTGFRYYGDPEDGARVTKGWFQVVPDSYLSPDDYEDDENNWYYSDKDGKLVASEIKTINGKKYAFDSFGVMKSGLKAIKFVGNSTTEIDEIKGDDGINNMHFDTEDNFKDNVSNLYGAGYKLYYFGSGDDGAMKTGKQTVSLDGEDYSFLFNKSGSSKGAGKLGIDDDKYYLGGMLLKASKDDKYTVIKITKDTNGTISALECLSTEEFLNDIDATSSIPAGKDDDYDEYYDVKEAAKDTNTTQYRLVNTSGSVQKNKNKAKDRDHRCYKVGTGKEIEAVFAES